MKSIAISFLISFLLLSVGLAIAYVKLADVDAFLAIHFDQQHSIDFLGTKADVFKILLSGVVLNAFNLFCAYIFSRREHFLSVLFSFFSIFVSVLILLSVSVIISNT
jgi:hypothetical protein